MVVPEAGAARSDYSQSSSLFFKHQEQTSFSTVAVTAQNEHEILRRDTSTRTTDKKKGRGSTFPHVAFNHVPARSVQTLLWHQSMCSHYYLQPCSLELAL